MNIGILGGTFDPIQNGHLAMAAYACNKLAMQRVLFIPNATPPHRAHPLASSEQRCRMIELALQGSTHWQLDKTEVNRHGPSYMVDTLATLKQAHAKDHLFLLIGMDAFNQLTHWHQWQKLFDYAKLIVFSRVHVAAQVDPRLTPYKQQIKIINNCHWPQSATRIREQIKQGLTHAPDLPQAVEQYIQANKLYTSTH